MVLPSVSQVIVTSKVVLLKLITGVAHLMLIEPEPMSEFIIPSFTAIALMFLPDNSSDGPVYGVDEVVGSVPSIV